MRRPFYIGAQRSGTAQGVYRSELDLESGTVSQVRLVARLVDASFLAFHPELDVLYACSEMDGADACVVAYRVEPDGALVEMSRQPSGGPLPCFVSTDHAGTSLLVANYGGGSIAAFPIGANGAVQPARMFEQFSGPRRSRAHCIRPDPTDRFFVVVDISLDRLLVYPSGAARTNAAAIPVSTFAAPAGHGPRHVAFHPGGHYAFVIYEYANVLMAMRWSDDGRLSECSSASTIPDDFAQDSTAAEVVVHPSGRFIFGSNRGHDSIATFAFDEVSGTLTPVRHTPSGGRGPRHFRLDSSGRILVVANQLSDSLVPFRVDAENGMLTQSGPAVAVEAPSCVTFMRS